MLALAPSPDLTAAEQFAMDLLVDLSRVVPFTGEADVVRVGVVGAAAPRSVRALSDSGWGITASDGAVHVERSLLQIVVDVAGAAAEQRSSARDPYGRVPSSDNPLVAEGLEREPVVSQAAQALGRAVCDAAGRRPVAFVTPWPDGRRWAAAFTHDLDVVDGWPVFTALRLAELARKGELSRGARVAVAALGAVLRRPVHGAITDVLRMERAHGVHSTWFVICGERTLGTWRAGDITYDPSSAVARKIYRDILAGGHEVGLHGSFATMDDAALLAAQRERLGALTGGAVHGVRQHFLRMQPGHTQSLMHDGGFAWDATFGFADRNGFRLGVADIVPSWNSTTQRTAGVALAPFTWMDRALSKYRGVEDPRAWVDDAIEVAQRCESVEGMWSGIWHPNLVAALGYPDAPAAYAALLECLLARDPYVAPLGDLVAWRRARAAVRAVAIRADGAPVLAPTAAGMRPVPLETAASRPLESHVER